MAGKPQHVPTDDDRQKVLKLAGFGFPQDRIAEVMGIAQKTLRRWYKTELKTGETVAVAAVAETLFDQATRKENPSVPAMIFFLKARAGWRETSVVEIAKGMRDEDLEAEAAAIIAKRTGDT